MSFVDQKLYWAKVREIEASLPPGPQILIAEEDGTNAAVEVSHEGAAKRLVEKSHRLATVDEIAKWRAGQKAAIEQSQREEYARKQQFALPNELNQLVTALLQSQAVDAQKKGKQ
jgi:hypothetical protein